VLTALQETIQVLHVDDEPEFADLTATFLERENNHFAVETETKPSRGLERIINRPPDCVVSDYNMPNMDGIEFLEAVRDDYSELPFILFTGKGSEDVASDALRADATDYIQKQSGSERYELLANRIENAVTQYRSQQRLRETREEYAAVFENAQNALILVQVEDNGFRYQQCNPQTIELIGQNKAEIVGSTPCELFGPEDAKKLIGAYRTCVAQREPVAYTVTLDLPTGEVIRECEVAPVSPEGEINQLVVEFRDITEQCHRQREFQQHASIIDVLSDAVYVLNEDGQFTYVNDEFIELVGYDRKTVLGSTQSLIKDEPTIEQAEQQLRRLLSDDGPETVSSEITVYPREGDPVVCEDHMGVLDEGNQLNGSVGTLRDITDQKENEQELREERTFVKQALNTLTDIFYVASPDGELRRWNDRLRRVSGYTDETITEMNVAEFFSSDDQGQIADAIEDTLTTGKATVEAGLVTTDGEHIPYEFTGARLTDADNNVTGFAGVGRDITDRRRRVNTLRKLHERTQTFITAPDRQAVADHAVETARTVLNHTLNTIWFYDETEKTLCPVAATDEARNLFGELPTYTGGESLSWQAFETGEVRVDNNLQTTPGRYNPDTPVESEILLPLGEHGVMNFGATEPNAFDEFDTYLAHILGDVVHAALVRADREQNLQSQREQLKHQNERLDEFVSVVSHDLQSPLQVANGRLELVQDDCDSEHLDNVARALDRMDALIEDVLTLAREGDRIGEVEPVMFANIVDDCWQTVAAPEAEIMIDDEWTIQADRSRLRQLLENLLRNAVEHGGENVSVKTGKLETGFYLEDDGPGISEGNRDDVFEAGYTTTRQGTGFGLRIVKQVVDAHGWEIVITNSEQGGARFEITGINVIED
jgi:PAS domain S-box